MTELFKRGIVVQLTENDSSGNEVKKVILNENLRTTFVVNKDLDNDPNTAEISVYNQSAESINKIIDLKSPNISFYAGYGKDLELLFQGQPTYITHDYIQNNMVTKIYCGDGLDFYRIPLSASFSGQSIANMIKDIKNKMNNDSTLYKAIMLITDGLDKLANIADGTEEAEITSSMRRIFDYAKGGTVNDFLSDFLEKMAKGYKKKLSIQDGNLTVLGNMEYIDEPAIILTKDTGLIGNVAYGMKKITSSQTNKYETILSAKALIQAGLKPGRKVFMFTDKVVCRVESVRYSGDTHGTNWYAEMEMKVTQ